MKVALVKEPEEMKKGLVKQDCFIANISPRSLLSFIRNDG